MMPVIAVGVHLIGTGIRMPSVNGGSGGSEAACSGECSCCLQRMMLQTVNDGDVKGLSGRNYILSFAQIVA